MIWRQFSLWSKGKEDNRTKSNNTAKAAHTKLSSTHLYHLANAEDEECFENAATATPANREHVLTWRLEGPPSRSGTRLAESLLKAKHIYTTRDKPHYMKAHTSTPCLDRVLLPLMRSVKREEHQRDLCLLSSESPRIASRPFLALDRFSSELHNRNLASLPGCNVRTASCEMDFERGLEATWRVDKTLMGTGSKKNDGRCPRIRSFALKKLSRCTHACSTSLSPLPLLCGSLLGGLTHGRHAERRAPAFYVAGTS